METCVREDEVSEFALIGRKYDGKSPRSGKLICYDNIYLFIYLFAQYHNKNVTSVNFHAAVLALTDFVAWFHNVVE